MNALTRLLQPRALFAVVGVFVIALLVTAWQLQYGPDKQQPCPLCILQRYIFMLITLIAFIGAAHTRAVRVYAGAGALLSVVGLGFALWQLLKGSEMTTCRADPIGVFVNGLPSAMWWPEYLFATGGCADKYPPLFGLSIPMWSFLCFAALLIAHLYLLVSAQKSAR